MKIISFIAVLISVVLVTGSLRVEIQQNSAQAEDVYIPAHDMKIKANDYKETTFSVERFKDPDFGIICYLTGKGGNGTYGISCVKM